MTRSRIYLDHNATAPLLPEAREAMLGALDATGNPSSVHADGQARRRLVEAAREDVGRLVGTGASQVVFTSGATEAAATLLTPDWRMGRSPLRMSTLYVCAADHPCTLSGGRFGSDSVVRFGVDANGIVRLDDLAALLAARDRAGGLPLVCIHWANNETGVIQPIERIATRVHEAGGVLVVDAVQAAGRIPLDNALVQADAVILSAHKIGGPAGVGAFVMRSDLMMPAPLVIGGGQERGFRAGTENVSGIAGFAAAARHATASAKAFTDVAVRRQMVERAVLAAAPDAEIHGVGADRLANTMFFSVPGLKAETIQIGMDLAGIAVSAGSACSSGKVGPSHVLAAMGKATPDGAVRVSIGLETTVEEIERFASVLAQIVARRSGRTASAA
jgi:cysteine desulfurase